MSRPIELVSFNVRGLRDRIKRRTIFRHMHVRYPKHIIVLQETHSSVEVENQWRAEWGSDVYFSHGDKTARGVCVLVPRNYDGDIAQIKSDDVGRTIIMKVVIQNLPIYVVGVYAPTQGHEPEQLRFFQNLREFLSALDLSMPFIVCGDLNVHMSVMDTDHIRFRDTQPCKNIREMMIDFGLVDVWRYINPEKRAFTWRRCHPLQQSRIDYFLISDVLIEAQKLMQTVISPGVRSDHSIISLAISVSGSKRGPGLWRFDNTLLEDKYLTDQIKKEIFQATNLDGNYDEIATPGLLMEVLLGNIRVLCIRRSSYLAKERKKKEHDLENRVADLENMLSATDDSQTVLESYNAAKRDLDDFKVKAAENAMLYCKAKWLEQGEKPTQYFLNLEKRRNANKTIHMLATGENEYVTGDREILKRCMQFFDDLHGSTNGLRNVSSYMQDMVLPRLEEGDRNRCEGPITRLECHEALKSMGANRAPSVSGFSREFMMFFWEEIGGMIVEYINDAYSSGKLFITQRRGVLTLIPKSGDQKELKNKRPICLLDIIYKIIAKVLVMRLGLVIGRVINMDQTGFLKGRCIQDNIRTIQDVIDYAEEDGMPGLVCALDFKSAFNSVEHEFIFHALRLFGFGESFIKWIALLYNDSELAVINNGYTSEWFRPKRGIMQGCPISGILFNLVVELLAIQIRESKDIKGMNISGQEIKISQYADDATVFVRDDESLKAMMDILKKFSEVSGLELNVQKSKLMWIGSERMRTTSVCGIPAVRRLKILGVYFSATQDCQNENLEPILNNIKTTINAWQQRSLSIKGRITVAKALLISKFVYIMPCVTIADVQLRQIQSHIMKFVWRGRPPKVAAKSLCQNIRDGGLRAIDVPLLYESIRASWVKRMLMDIPWAKILRAKCNKFNIHDLLNCRYIESDLLRLGIPNFYLKVLGNFRRLNKLTSPKTSDQLKREYIWFNEYIKCDGKTIFEGSMYRCGISYVGDVMDSRGKLLRYDELKQKFPSLRLNFLRYMGIISAIPESWKNKVRGPSEREGADGVLQGQIIMGDKHIFLHKLRTRDIYNLGMKKCIPTALTRWENEGLAPLKWSEILQLPYNCTRSTRLQSFQFQIIHRYIPTKKYLHLRGLAKTPICFRCNRIDNIAHHFYLCPSVKYFWNDVFSFINECTKKRMRPTLQNVMFGMLTASPVLNLLIIVGKCYIHSCNVRERPITFNSYLSRVIEEFEVEKRVAIGCSIKISDLHDRWKILNESASGRLFD